MKIAILADIHANLTAFERVLEDIDRWRPDAVLFAGDAINRGPHPLPCLNIILERQRCAGWRLVQGNHEEYVLLNAASDAPRQGPQAEIWRNSTWTLQRLNGQVAALAAMPFQQSLAGPDGREVRAVHASMKNNRDGLYPEMNDRELAALIQPAPAVLAAGHTHRPFIRQLKETLVINVGSVGAPFDRDRRASYVRLSWRRGRWQAKIIRLPYAWETVERDFFASGFIEEGGPLAQIMLAEFRLARPYINYWSLQYEKAVLRQKMSLAEAVAAFWQDNIPLDYPIHM